MTPSHRLRDLEFESPNGADTPVCPDAGLAAHQTVSGWARAMFGFHPSAKQAEVLDTQSKYLILCCNRQWGKTTTIAIKSLHHALSVPGQSVVVISRTKDQAGLLIEKVSDAAASLGLPTRRVLGQRYSFRFPNGSAICAVAHDEDTAVGRTANVLVVDEAARVKDKVFFTVAAFVARTHGSIWLLSTPKRQVGFFYNYWHDRDPRWTRILSNVQDCPEIDPDFLEFQKRADPHGYEQDFLCRFVQPPDRLISREAIEAIVYTKEEMEARGIDWWR